MRSLLIRLVAAALLSLGLAAITSTSSFAGGGTTCTHTNPYTGLCVTTVEVPGSPGTPQRVPRSGGT